MTNIPEITADAAEPVEVPVPLRPDWYFLTFGFAGVWLDHDGLSLVRLSVFQNRSYSGITDRRIVRIPGEG